MKAKPFKNEEINARNKINEKFNEIQRLNPHFSLRALARKVNLNPGVLSGYLKGLRSLDYTLVVALLEAVKINKNEINDTLKATLNFYQPSQRNQILDSKLIKVELKNLEQIDEAIFFEILSYIEIQGNFFDLEDLSKKLQITTKELHQKLKILESCGFLKIDGERVQKIACNPMTIGGCSHHSSFKLGLEVLEKSISAYKSEKVDHRNHAFVVIPSDPAKLPLARELISDFQGRMVDLMGNEDKSAVYYLSIHLFPKAYN